MSENRTVTDKPKRKAPSTAFKPGQSGNPGGRPKIPEEFKKLARENSIPVLQQVIKIALDEKAKHSDRLRAAEILFDRGFGKPQQGIDISTQTERHNELVEKVVSDPKLLEIAKELYRKAVENDENEPEN